jgi:hypothetical protein
MQGLGIFLFTIVSTLNLGPTQPPIQGVPVALSLEVKWSGHEADHSHTSSAEVRNVWSYTSAPQYIFIEWCSLKNTGANLSSPFNLKGRDHLEDLGIVGKTLEWVLGQQCGKLWTGFIWLRIGTNGGLL